jgi:hypothetical protein
VSGKNKTKLVFSKTFKEFCATKTSFSKVIQKAEGSAMVDISEIVTVFWWQAQGI